MYYTFKHHISVYFRFIIKEVSKKPLKDAESGIGLVRIAYEGKALLDFFVGENSILNVSVVANIEGDDRKLS